VRHHRVVVRSTEQKWVLLAIFLLFVPTGFYKLWVEYGDLGPVVRIVFTVILLIGGVLILRTAFASVVLDKDRVTIRGPIRRTRIGWEQLHSFVLRPRGPAPGIGHAVLRDGRIIPIWGIAIPNPLFRDRSRRRRGSCR
jgi:hypothetical protein